MKKGLFTLCIATLLFLLGACKKEPSDTTTVSGTVVDATTGKGIPNATVILLRHTLSLLGGSGAPYQNYQTDSNGNFHIDFKQENGYGYDIIPVMPYEHYWDAQSTSISKGGNNTVTLKLDPKGYIKIHYKSINPDVTGIELHMHVYGDFLLGAPVDTTFLDACYGNQTNFYHVGIFYRNGSSFHKIDTIFCPPFDTISYEFIIK